MDWSHLGEKVALNHFLKGLVVEKIVGRFLTQDGSHLPPYDDNRHLGDEGRGAIDMVAVHFEQLRCCRLGYLRSLLVDGVQGQDHELLRLIDHHGVLVVRGGEERVDDVYEHLRLGVAEVLVELGLASAAHDNLDQGGDERGDERSATNLSERCTVCPARSRSWEKKHRSPEI